MVHLVRVGAGVKQIKKEEKDQPGGYPRSGADGWQGLWKVTARVGVEVLGEPKRAGWVGGPGWVGSQTQHL